MKMRILMLNEVLQSIQEFCKNEEIDMEQDADKIALVLHENGDIHIKAFCGKSFQEAMQNGEFDFQ